MKRVFAQAPVFACLLQGLLVVLTSALVTPTAESVAAAQVPELHADGSNAGPAAAPADGRAVALQVVVDDLRARLSVPQEVTVALADENPLLVSVERDAQRDNAFLLVIEQGFLDQLTDVERRAAVAHELGHVWIFTHHPYLHTEALANRIAMRLVSRDALAQVYRRMWRRQGIDGDLTRYIADPTPDFEAVGLNQVDPLLEETNLDGRTSRVGSPR